MFDFIIVGQGIVGSILTYQLIHKGYSCIAIDVAHKDTASYIASGLINPVTGKRLVKTWMIEQLLPLSDEIYSSIEDFLSISVYSKPLYYKICKNIQEQNDWSIRAGTSPMESYLNNSLYHHDIKGIKTPLGYFKIDNTRKVNMPLLLDTWRKYMRSIHTLHKESFKHNKLIVNESSVRYKSLIAKHIIFAEGFAASQNPYFDWLPLLPTKGEALHIQTNVVDPSAIYNNGILLMPINQKTHTFYVGSTFDWENIAPLITQKAKQRLTKKLDDMLHPLSTYSITHHKGAIRPTVKDRRPLVGTHPAYKRVHICNGMGTKGVSLAPFCTKELINSIIHKRKVLKEINIDRYVQLYRSSL